MSSVGSLDFGKAKGGKVPREIDRRIEEFEVRPVNVSQTWNIYIGLKFSGITKMNVK